jgi:hypothetical protein
MKQKQIITGALVLVAVYLLYTQLTAKKKPCGCRDNTPSTLVEEQNNVTY